MPGTALAAQDLQGRGLIEDRLQHVEKHRIEQVLHVTANLRAERDGIELAPVLLDRSRYRIHDDLFALAHAIGLAAEACSGRARFSRAGDVHLGTNVRAAS